MKTVKTQLFDLINCEEEYNGSIPAELFKYFQTCTNEQLSEAFRESVRLTKKNTITRLEKFLGNKEIQILDLISKGPYEEAMKAEPITNAEIWRDKSENKENAKL